MHRIGRWPSLALFGPLLIPVGAAACSSTTAPNGATQDQDGGNPATDSGEGTDASGDGSPAPTMDASTRTTDAAVPDAARDANADAATPSSPGPAAAAGYTTRTLGPDVTLGQNWHVWSSAVQATQNKDGSVTTTGGGNDYGEQLVTAVPGTGSFQGTAFGGGAYFEATMSLGGGADLYGAAFWANDIEEQAGLGAQWQGQAAGFDDWIEVDFAEFDVHAANQYGFGIHNWYGMLSNVQDTNTGQSSSFGSPTTVPAGSDLSKPHAYGFLWIPATATTQGSAAYYFDGVEVPGSKVTWNRYDPSLAPPPVVGGTAFSVMDARHLYLILGTSVATNPLTVYAVSVWQASSVGNLTK